MLYTPFVLKFHTLSYSVNHQFYKHTLFTFRAVLTHRLDETKKQLSETFHANIFQISNTGLITLQCEIFPYQYF